jgi:hypothetical protein
MSQACLPISKADETRLVRAYHLLEYPSFAGRLSGVVGTPIEMTMKLLPRPWYRTMHRCAEAGISRALDVAIAGAQRSAEPPRNDQRYTLLGMASGALGGFFGGPALLLELPVTTTLMLSSIVNIARSYGEDVNALETRMACMEVFALGGRNDLDDATETGYYGLRLALELPIASASRFLSRPGAAVGGNAPVLVNLVRALAERFGVVLSQKAMAEIVPVIGAVGGAFTNHIFIRHFQDMAHGHFTVRRLERKYNRETVQLAYRRIRQHQLALSQPRKVLPSSRKPALIGTAAA